MSKAWVSTLHSSWVSLDKVKSLSIEPDVGQYRVLLFTETPDLYYKIYLGDVNNCRTVARGIMLEDRSLLDQYHVELVKADG